MTVVAFLPPSPQPPPVPGPPAPPPTGPPGRPAVLGLHARQWMVVAIVLGCCYLMVSAIALTGAWATMNREPTVAELRHAAAAEVARRWQVWPAGRIFPERVAYTVRQGRSEFASRTGIAAQTGCDTTVDPEIAAVLRRHGCRAVLRATYADQLQGVVVTVGVVAFPDAWKADRAFRELPATPLPDRSSGVRPALRAASFPGTASARFIDAARQDRTSDRGGPYVMLTTSGHADGRPAAAVTKTHPDTPYALAPQLARGIVRPLSMQARPDCAGREWRC
ncbi:hypothetical protein [Actinomadura viridis]|uniref:Uncharacterized protein n=1 Tax=Actinomadura viridis TaxID=58110 RepID=A0A931DEL0_9ACTN|nr:hypothetical protein [Actinomadura viridis]MBG6087399.1 hypothetical protein [Actinomadura viridis]